MTDLYSLVDRLVEAGPQPCPVCATTTFEPASRGLITCDGGHVFTMKADLSGVVRVDHLPEAEAAAMVDAGSQALHALPY